MVSIKATIRDEKIKISALREKGFIPGVLYGEDIKNTSVFVGEKDFEKTLKESGETTIVEVELSGKKIDTLIHQIAKDPVSGKAMHIDFFHPSSKNKMEAKVPLVFEGESEAVASLGGVLIRELDEIELKGLAKDLPKDIIIDVSVLATLEDKITVGDLKLPIGLEIVGHNMEDIVAHVVLVKEEEEMKAPETAEEEEGGEDTETVEGEEGGEKGEKSAEDKGNEKEEK